MGSQDDKKRSVGNGWYLAIRLNQFLIMYKESTKNWFKNSYLAFKNLQNYGSNELGLKLSKENCKIDYTCCQPPHFFIFLLFNFSIWKTMDTVLGNIDNWNGTSKVANYAVQKKKHGMWQNGF